MMKMAPLFETMEADCRLPANHRDRRKKTSNLEINISLAKHFHESFDFDQRLFHYYVHLYVFTILFSSRSRAGK